MKHAILALACSVFCMLGVKADTICQWNFNSATPDGSTSTGSLAPAVGAGSVTLLNGVTSTFSGGGSPDPVGSADDSVLSTSKYPGTLFSNCTAGVRFNVSTLGFESIAISWAQQNSSTASKYMRLQVTLDGTNFFNLFDLFNSSGPGVIAVPFGSTWTNFVFDLSGLSGATNNARFGFQLVAEFESTAAGGLPGYMGSDGLYDTGGTIKLDMVTVSGQTIGDNNTPPYIFPQINDQVVAAAGSSGALGFTVLDAEEPATNLVVLKGSSNPGIIPLDRIVLGGQGANRTVTVQGAGVAGTARVDLKVVDSGGKFASMGFGVTVLPANSSPVVTPPGFAHGLMNRALTPVGFSVWDGETAAWLLSVGASSLNTALLPPGGVHVVGTGTNRSVSLNPSADRYGVAPVVLTASDGENTTTAAFPLMILPSEDVIFYDAFDYPSGSAATNSGFLWGHRAGTYGDCRVTNSMLRLTEDASEDVSAPLVGGPYDPGTGAVVFVSFRLRVSGLPSRTPDAFFHFMSGSSLVGKVLMGTTNAVEGCYRLFVCNGPNGTPTNFPMSMDINVPYRVVMKYDVDAGRSTLWVNPGSEQSACALATDVLDPGRVATLNFRQSSGIGPELWVDEVRAGYSFGSVTLPMGRPMLSIEGLGNSVRLSWSDPAYKLQCSGWPGGGFTNVPGAVSPHTVGMQPGGGYFRLRGE